MTDQDTPLVGGRNWRATSARWGGDIRTDALTTFTGYYSLRRRDWRNGNER